eukprot:8717464-Alexandrium_andersonii.AAC.1
MCKSRSKAIAPSSGSPDASTVQHANVLSSCPTFSKARIGLRALPHAAHRALLLLMGPFGA